jgi:mRNA interferase MazF
LKGEDNMKVKRGDIWYADLDGIGCEQKGIKPVVIVQNNKGNEASNTVIVVTVTSRQKHWYMPTHAKIFAKCPSTAMAEVIKTIDKQRLLNKIGVLSPKEIEELDNALKISIGL